MTEDIVTRLRFWSETRNNQPTSWNIDCAQAADEIERLRRERDEANANAKLYRDDRDRMSRQLLEEQRQ